MGYGRSESDWVGDREAGESGELVKLLRKALSVPPPPGSVERVWEKISREVSEAPTLLQDSLENRVSPKTSEGRVPTATKRAVSEPSVPESSLAEPWVPEPSVPEPSVSAQSVGGKPPQEAGKTEAEASPGAAPSRPRRRGYATRLGRKRAGILLAAALALVVGLAATASAAEGARPGNPLYSLKRARESVRLWFAADERAKAEVRLLRAERRLDEAADSVRAAKYDTALELIAEYGGELAAVEEVATRRADVAEMLAARVQADESQFEEVSQGLEVARARVPPEGAAGLERAESVHQRYRGGGPSSAAPNRRSGPPPGVGAPDQPRDVPVSSGPPGQASKGYNGQGPGG